MAHWVTIKASSSHMTPPSKYLSSCLTFLAVSLSCVCFWAIIAINSHEVLNHVLKHKWWKRPTGCSWCNSPALINELKMLMSSSQISDFWSTIWQLSGYLLKESFDNVMRYLQNFTHFYLFDTKTCKALSWHANAVQIELTQCMQSSHLFWQLYLGNSYTKYIFVFVSHIWWFFVWVTLVRGQLCM